MRTAAIGPITDIDERPLTTQSGRSDSVTNQVLHVTFQVRQCLDHLVILKVLPDLDPCGTLAIVHPGEVILSP